MSHNIRRHFVRNFSQSNPIRHTAEADRILGLILWNFLIEGVTWGLVKCAYASENVRRNPVRDNCQCFHFILALPPHKALFGDIIALSLSFIFPFLLEI